MSKRITRALAGRLRRLDEDEGGAILLAAMAGCLILFMVALTLYDAGNVTREKVKLQTSIDSAAYSQAAIKARTLNANAYTNVAKRSILGLELTYVAAFNYYYNYMWELYSSVAIVSGHPGQANALQITVTPKSCHGISSGGPSGGPAAAGSVPECSNIGVVVRERQRDWGNPDSPGANADAYSFGGTLKNPKMVPYCQPSTPSNPATNTSNYPNPLGNSACQNSVPRINSLTYTFDAGTNELVGALSKYNKELKQLSTYQGYMQKVTPWWAFSEALTRAAHNGATMATTYPAPPNLNTSALNPAYPGGPNAAQADNMDTDWMWPGQFALSGGPEVMMADQLKTSAGHICHQFTGGGAGGSIIGDPLFAQEVQVNTATLQVNSDADARDVSDIYAAVQMADRLGAPGGLQAARLSGYSLCYMSHMANLTEHPDAPNNITAVYKEYSGTIIPAFAPEVSSPYLVTIDPNSSELARMRLSNIVFGYTQGSDFMRQSDGAGPGMTRFEFMKGNSMVDYNITEVQKSLGSGIWTMARGEVVTLGDSPGNWHTAWTARLRPVARPGELQGVENEMNIPSGSFLVSAFRTARPYLGINEKLVHKSNLAPHHPEVWTKDANTADRAFQAMDSASTVGLTK